MSTLSNLVKVSLCVAIFAVSYVDWFKNGNNTKKLISVKKVPRISWSIDRPFADYLEENATPLILENSVVTTWDALSKWSSVKKLAKFIGSSRLENIFHHQLSHGQVFGPFFDSTRPFASLNNVLPINPYETDASLTIKEMTRVFGEEFEYSCVNESVVSQSRLSGCWAFSGSLMEVMGDEAMIEPLEELLKLNPSASSVNLWIGQRGITTPCHFDGYHNMYVQIAGSKRFVLYPPSDIVHLRSYPFLHPSYAQCQSPLPRELLSPVIAELFAGDLLYIPPFWTHEVTATSSSISVNVWTAGNDEGVMERVLAVPLPTVTTTDAPQTKAQMGSRLISMFLAAYFKTEPARVALLAQLRQRYEHMDEGGEREEGVCQDSNSRVELKVDESMSIYVSAVMQELAPLSSQGKDPTLSPWIANFVEFLAVSHVQLPQVPAYVLQLSACERGATRRVS